MSFLEQKQRIDKDIAKAAALVHRNPTDITLIAVSKKQPENRIEEALDAGHRIFGENRVQEAAQRWQDRRQLYPDLQLHLIGPLQTNKAKEAVALFDCIQTVDREKLVKALAAEMTKQGRHIPCLIQVNTGEEAQKAGVLPENLPDLLHICKEEGVPVTGLMCIPPFDEPPGVHFAFLKTMADQHGLEILSMGMSNDYDKAIMAGATHVRVGSALFGSRPV